MTEYIDGNLDGWKLFLFEQKMNKNKKFRKKVDLSQRIEKSMKVLTMVEEAEKEMRTKGIDKLAFELVGDWYKNDRSFQEINEYGNLFLS